MAKHGAEMMFIEDSPNILNGQWLGNWHGFLRKGTLDRQAAGKPASNYIATIRTLPSGRCEVVMQGRSKFARQTFLTDTVEEAQAVLAKWAKRRFYTED